MNVSSDTTDIPRPTLPLARYRVRFREHVPPGGVSIASPRTGYLGSAWRGAFGHALRKAVCVTRLPACDPCVLLRSCSYPFLFESRTPPGAEKLTRYPRTPGPVVLEPADPRFDTCPGDGTLNLGVTLFGSAADHLPYVVHALEQAGRQGLTGRRVVLDLLDVQVESRGLGASDAGSTGDAADADERGDPTPAFEPADGRANADMRGDAAEREEWTPIFEPGGGLSPVPARPPAPPPAPPRIVRVRLLTPLRVKRREHFVGVQDFDFRALTSGLLRRISLLTYFFGETPLETDFAGLLRHAETVPVAGRALHWREWTRYSSRQNEKLQMGGLVGSFELAGADLDRFWPLLWLGQWTHAGKGCSIRAAAYKITVPSIWPWLLDGARPVRARSGGQRGRGFRAERQLVADAGPALNPSVMGGAPAPYLRIRANAGLPLCPTESFLGTRASRPLQRLCNCAHRILRRHYGIIRTHRPDRNGNLTGAVWSAGNGCVASRNEAFQPQT